MIAEVFAVRNKISMTSKRSIIFNVMKLPKSKKSNVVFELGFSKEANLTLKALRRCFIALF